MLPVYSILAQVWGQLHPFLSWGVEPPPWDALRLRMSDLDPARLRRVQQSSSSTTSPPLLRDRSRSPRGGDRSRSRDRSRSPRGHIHAAEERTNKSQLAVNNFVAYIREGKEDMRNMLSAMKEDAVVARGVVRTGWDEARRLTWSEFCGFHDLDGDRFKLALEALMELETPAGLTLRAFADDDVLLKVDMLLGGPEKALQLWVRCAVFLARHLEHPIPLCMQPGTNRCEE